MFHDDIVRYIAFSFAADSVNRQIHFLFASQRLKRTLCGDVTWVSRRDLLSGTLTASRTSPLTSTFDLRRRKCSTKFSCRLLHAVVSTSPTVDVSSTWISTDCTQHIIIIISIIIITTTTTSSSSNSSRSQYEQNQRKIVLISFRRMWSCHPCGRPAAATSAYKERDEDRCQTAYGIGYRVKAETRAFYRFSHFYLMLLNWCLHFRRVTPKCLYLCIRSFCCLVL